MANSSALSDGAQQANMVSNENAETMFGADQAETNMVKLVDGKLTPIGDTHDDVMDEQLRNRYSSDEERSLQGDQQRSKTYENSDAALRAGNGMDPEQMPDNPIAVADITDTTPRDRVQPNGADQTNTSGVFGMIPQPGENPIPSTPDAPIPPTPPSPGPEFPPMPGQPTTPTPDIQEPSEPGRSHEINASDANRASVTYQPYGYYGFGGFVSRTATLDYNVDPGEAVPGNQYEGMGEDPDTGDSAHPYDVSANDADPYQAGERPQEAQQMQDRPTASMDESSQKKADMDDTTGSNGSDPSEMKSTEGLDRNYNDSDARGVI